MTKAQLHPPQKRCVSGRSQKRWSRVQVHHPVGPIVYHLSIHLQLAKKLSTIRRVVMAMWALLPCTWTFGWIVWWLEHLFGMKSFVALCSKTCGVDIFLKIGVVTGLMHQCRRGGVLRFHSHPMTCRVSVAWSMLVGDLLFVLFIFYDFAFNFNLIWASRTHKLKEFILKNFWEVKMCF